MPIASDPDKTVPFSLKNDRNKPEESRPTFLCKFLTSRERRAITDLTNKAYEEKDDTKAAELMNKATAVGVIGWKNFGLPFSIDAIQDVLTDLERWELLREYPYAVSLSEIDLGKSASPALSAQENAKPVPQSDVDAASPQQK